eukprot:s736_g2.t1
MTRRPEDQDPVACRPPTPTAGGPSDSRSEPLRRSSASTRGIDAETQVDFCGHGLVGWNCPQELPGVEQARPTHGEKQVEVNHPAENTGASAVETAAPFQLGSESPKALPDTDPSLLDASTTVEPPETLHEEPTATAVKHLEQRSNARICRGIFVEWCQHVAGRKKAPQELRSIMDSLDSGSESLVSMEDGEAGGTAQRNPTGPYALGDSSEEEAGTAVQAFAVAKSAAASQRGARSISSGSSSSSGGQVDHLEVLEDASSSNYAFLIEHKVDAAQLGSFMGEDFSLAQTLRLAFVHTMDLAGTGVVGALRKVFSYMRPPRELHKIDRITTAAAHLWWRTHDLDDCHTGNLHEADETLQWAMYAEAELVVIFGVGSMAGMAVSRWFLVLALALAQDDGTCDAQSGQCTSDPGAPHGGTLVDLILADDAAKKMIASTNAKLELSERQACDVSLLINGGFSPLKGFMKKADYESVVASMRLTSGHLFGLPVVLDVADESLKGKKVLLTYAGTNLAVLEAEEIFKPDKVIEAKASYGTTSTEHPSVAELFSELGKFYLGGKLHGLTKGFDAVWGKGFNTPAQVRASLPKGKQVVAFQNRNPVHKAHFELLVHANKDVENSIILVHPTCGPTQPGDIDGATRIKTYEVLQQEPEYKLILKVINFD